MHRFHCVAIVLLFLREPSAIAAEPPAETHPAHSGNMLRRLAFATFSGEGQTAIRALAADSIGNVYVTGTTSAPDFPVKNAAQPASGLAGIMRTADLGATWTRVGSPPQDITVSAPDPIAPEVLFASGPTGI